MKAKMIAVTLVLCFAGVAVCFAEDPNMGTWKLNEAKSKLSAGVQKNNMVVYEPAGDSVKITLDGTSGDGQSTHTEWTGKFDSKDYPVTGDPASDSRSYKRVNARTCVHGEKGRQGYDEWTYCCFGRWQDPHGHFERNRF